MINKKSVLKLLESLAQKRLAAEIFLCSIFLAGYYSCAVFASCYWIFQRLYCRSCFIFLSPSRLNISCFFKHKNKRPPTNRKQQDSQRQFIATKFCMGGEGKKEATHVIYLSIKSSVKGGAVEKKNPFQLQNRIPFQENWEREMILSRQKPQWSKCLSLSNSRVKLVFIWVLFSPLNLIPSKKGLKTLFQILVSPPFLGYWPNSTK